MEKPLVSRSCPECRATVPPMAVRCDCGFVLPESRDIRSNPEEPRCGACGEAIALMTERCPSCSASGYPALRPRQGKKCQRAGDLELLSEKPD